MPTSSHVSAPSYDPIVTSNKLLVFFFSHGIFWWYNSDFFRVCNDLAVLRSYVRELGCVIKGLGEKLLRNGWVEVTYIESYERVLGFIRNCLKPFDDI